MHFYALDETTLISPLQATKGKNYLCPECQATVRIKEGDIRKAHFFHLQQTSNCHLAQKGMPHLQLQLHLQELFKHEAILEKHFPTIDRRADVALPLSKKIFEIQYSPISLEEAKSRCHDYESLGYQVIWLLHEATFNQTSVAAAEQFLRTKTCYFTNMDEEGKGVIYDQLDVIRMKRRSGVEQKSPIDLRNSAPLPKYKWPQELFLRAQTWPLFHKGDLFDLALKGKFKPTHRPRKSLLKFLRETYATVLYKALERNAG